MSVDLSKEISWPMVRVGDISQSANGRAFKSTEWALQGTPIIRIQNLNRKDASFNYFEGTVDERIRVRDGDLLFAWSGTPGTSFGAHIWRGPDAALNQHIFKLSFDRTQVDPKFFCYALNRNVAGYIEKAQGGVGLAHVTKSKFENSLVPLPTICEQREIVAELEKQFSRLDESVANLKRVKANLKRYKASVLKAAVEGRLVETEGEWRQVKLGEIALSVRNGYSHKPDADSGTRIFRISAVRPMELATGDVRYLSGTPADFETFLTVAGDVLFTRYNGSRDYVGVCAQVPAGLAPTVYPDKLIRVRVPPDQLLAAFLVISASTGQGREFVESMIRTTAGQSGVSGSDIKAIPLSIPSLAEQSRIVAEVDRHLSIIREVEAEVDANLQRARALRQSTLANAFGYK